MEQVCRLAETGCHGFVLSSNPVLLYLFSDRRVAKREVGNEQVRGMPLKIERCHIGYT